MTHETISLEAYRDLEGRSVGVSEWMRVDQERIDGFARLTGDHQFIHVDPERARGTPFGGTVAHGFLTLSLLPVMADATVPPVEGVRMGVNYGANRLRFLAPVRSGRRVRGRFVLKSMIERTPGQWLSTLDVAVEIEAEAKPALVAEWLTMMWI